MAPRHILLAVIVTVWALVVPMKGWTQAGSLYVQGGEAQPLFTRVAAVGVDDTLERQQSASLFGDGAQGIFRALPLRFQGPVARGMEGSVALLRDLIARAEAGSKGYDAVQYGARIKPALPPTQMTVQEIYDWIDATPGQPHAIGRYQFIPDTLAYLIERLEIPLDARFNPDLQDRLADELLIQGGLKAFLAGELGRVDFMNNIARIWAGFPNSSGRSHYHGYAGNKATITWAAFEAEMIRIFGSG